MLLQKLQLGIPLVSLQSLQLRLSHSHIKRAALYQKCYRILGVENNADQNTIRRAYIDLVKMVHPDSGHPDASAERFQEVDEAFKVLQEKFAKNRRGICESDEEMVFDIRHTAPQHRQYLNFDGVGIGSPFQRQKQYQQVKAIKAQERVLNHRLEKSQAGEGTVMKKGQFYKNHAIKTKYGFDRVVEDLIQEAMSKGDFQNLSGTGKPLTAAQSQNPYLDFTTHKLNKILLDNGFTPEWITLQRDIRVALADLKDSLKQERAFFGDYPLSREGEEAEWHKIVARFKNDEEQINRSIDKYNLIVPILEQQMFRIDLIKLSQDVLTDANALRNFSRINSTTEEVNQSKTTNTTSDLFGFIGSLF